MIPTYSTGTASVTAGGTVVTGVGTIWSGINVKQGDFIQFGTVGTALVTEVTDTTHLKISAWPWATQSGVAYTIYQNYVGRVVGVAAAEDVGDMLERLKSYGPIFAVPDTDPAPDPSYGAEGQYAYQQLTNTWWQKTGGVWVMSATPVKGYGGTSTTSITIGTGAKAFTTQPGLAYLSGQRVRAIVSTDATKWLEGVATYNAVTGALSIASDTTSGTGTFASWGFTVGGTAGGISEAASDGKYYARLNAAWADVANMAVRYDAAQTLTTAQKRQLQTNEFLAPTTQVFTSGSGTYTTPAGCLWIEVQLIGGGGGGGGSGTSAGSGGTGGNTTFGSLTGGGAAGNAGGTASGGSINVVGHSGQSVSGLTLQWGGAGASGFLGGGGPGGAPNSGTAAPGLGQNATANTGSGGGGAGDNTIVNTGPGGGSGGYVYALINAPAATYAYAVGAGGSAGTAGTSGSAGGNGGSGIIIVKEFYGA